MHGASLALGAAGLLTHQLGNDHFGGVPAHVGNAVAAVSCDPVVVTGSAGFNANINCLLAVAQVAEATDVLALCVCARQ